MNDCVKSCREQFVPVFDLPGEEDDGDSGRVAAGCLKYAEGNLAGQSLPVRLAFSRDDETAFPDAAGEMDGFQDRLDAGVHFRAEAHRERGADAAGRAGPGLPVRVDSVLRLPAFSLAANRRSSSATPCSSAPFWGPKTAGAPAGPVRGTSTS